MRDWCDYCRMVGVYKCPTHGLDAGPTLRQRTAPATYNIPQNPQNPLDDENSPEEGIDYTHDWERPRVEAEWRNRQRERARINKERGGVGLCSGHSWNEPDEAVPEAVPPPKPEFVPSRPWWARAIGRVLGR